MHPRPTVILAFVLAVIAAGAESRSLEAADSHAAACCETYRDSPTAQPHRPVDGGRMCIIDSESSFEPEAELTVVAARRTRAASLDAIAGPMAGTRAPAAMLDQRERIVCPLRLGGSDSETHSPVV